MAGGSRTRRAGSGARYSFPGVIFFAELHFRARFGEAEYWFSLIKVATVIIFIIVGAQR